MLLAGCSSSAKHGAGPAGTARQTTTSTTGKAKPATTTGPTTTTTPATIYRVKRGDKLATIAKLFHIPVTAIVSVNHMTNPDRLAEGQALRIPRSAPLGLVITPAEGPAGQRFHLALIGLKPTEVIKFEIDSPTGKHTGPPHIAAADGAVSSTYDAGAAGTYKVIARGNKGSTTRAAFRVVKR